MSYYHSSGHICGLYYNLPTNQYRPQKVYLPQVQLQAHATILSTTSRTVLKQTFVNPSSEKAIREVRYTFPLYDGVSVVGFTCHVGDRTIVGEVKEKEKARAVFKDAVAKGQTAGLFEQLPDASDVFTTTVGNIPPGAKVIVEITYLGELKHDMEVDGVRFTIPNIICPRYGSYPTGLHSNATAQEAIGNGISITVDADMADGSFIQKIQSPSHPISMTMGTTSLAPDADPTMTKASASLTLGTAELDKDFIVQIIAKNSGVPKAVLETHPSIPNHKALMATLVPKFALPPEKPELVFVCDRSGSMDGSNMRLVKQALKVFLKSLPVGVKFNICSFGSSYSFLWPKSVTYSETTLDEAIRHAETFNANFGGTEMLQPIKATIEQRYNDMPLDLMLLTDGEIWNQNELFSYLNESVQDSKAPIRVFTLGIGNGASHALIEGVAKAGNGFSQTVADGEKMDTKVVRMLKGALSPHINDYTLEVKYADTNADGEDDDFELVEKVRDSLKVNLKISDAAANPITKPISLFDTSANPDQEDAAVPDETGEARYAHLPSIAVPKIVQAPQNIPSLFAFNRTTVYLLLGPEAPKAKPTSVTLRGTSAHGPLELEIPVQSLEQSGDTIHQMAAKKTISELEQGRGWLPQAKDDTNTLLKTKFEGRFDDMVEREAVRLGVQFQVGGKWCSFVAVESKKKDTQKEKEKEIGDWEFVEDETKTQSNPPGFSGNKPGKSFQFSCIGAPSPDFIAGPSFLPADKPMDGPLIFSSDEDEEEEESHHIVSEPDANTIYQPTASVRKRRRTRNTFIDIEGEVDEDEDEAVEDRRATVNLSQNNTALLSHDGNDFTREEYNSGDDEDEEGLSGLFMRESASDSEDEDYEPPVKYLASVDQKTIAPHNPGPIRHSLRGTPQPFATSSSNQKIQAFFGAPSPQNIPAKRSGSALLSSSSSSHVPNNHALQDYQMQMMLLEQQNKKRLLMARQDQDTGNVVQYGGAQAPGPPPTSGHGPGNLFGGIMAGTAGREGGGGAFPPPLQAQQMQQAQQQSLQQSAPAPPSPPPGTHIFGHGAPAPYNMHYSLAPAPQSFGASPPLPPSFGGPPRTTASLAAPPPPPQPPAPFGSFGAANGDPSFDLSLDFSEESALENFDFDSFLQNPGGDDFDPMGGTFDFNPGSELVGRTPEELTHYLISLQTFQGFWEMTAILMRELAIEDWANKAVEYKLNPTTFATALVVAVFEGRLEEFEGSWELVVEKAKGWLKEQGTDVASVVAKMGELVKQMPEVLGLHQVAL